MRWIFRDISHILAGKYFHLNEKGDLKLRENILGYQVIDMHTHVSWNYILGKPVNLEEESPVKHFFPMFGYRVDLRHYSALDFPQSLVKYCRKETVKPILNTNGITRTHTLLNLRREMANVNIGRSAILAIDMVGTGNSRRLLSASRKYKFFYPFVSVHPLSIFCFSRLAQLAKIGAKGLKIHPAIQMVKPSHPRVIELCRMAGKLGMPVILHSGHSPLSPRWQSRFTLMSDFEILVKECPDTTIILGHAGILEYQRATEISRKNRHVYLEISGQPPLSIRYMIEHADGNRIIFGSDWPYYPIALSLVKTLLATEAQPVIRRKILRDNALRLFDDSRKQY